LRPPRSHVPSFGSELEADIHSWNPGSLSNSIESLPSRSELFKSGLDFLTSDLPSPASDSRVPLFDGPEITREETTQVGRMEAIQGALADLIVGENKRDKSKKPIGSDSGGTSRSGPRISGNRCGLARDFSPPEHPRSPVFHPLVNVGVRSNL